VLTHSDPPKAGYLQQTWRWLYFFFIVIIVNVFLVFLLLQFIIIPYLIKVGDLPNDTFLNFDSVFLFWSEFYNSTLVHERITRN
jgi:hypothetical protein